MLIQDRVRLIIKANGESSSSFADKVGIKRANLSHVLSGRNKPSLDFLSKVINAYPSVNASWLLTGETRDGEFIGGNPSDKSVQNINRESVDRIVIFYKDGTFKSYKELSEL